MENQFQTPNIMNILKSACVSGAFLLGGFVPFAGADNQKDETAILGGIATGEVSKVEVRKKREFSIKTTHKQTVGNRSVTINEVEPPPQKPKAAKPHAVDNKRQLTPEKAESNIPPKLIVMSAIVYGRGEDTLSKITIWHEGKKCVALSRVDFRIMSGFTQFKANGRPYFLIEHVIDADAPGRRVSAKPRPRNYRIPMNGFVVTDMDSDDQQSRQVLSDLHKLYRVEQVKLREAYTKRTLNKQREKPAESEKPVTIHFWKRDMSKENRERGAK